MKKATIARFVMGMAAIFAAGCSAETGAPDEGVGASEQAINISSLANGYKSKFPAFIKLDANNVLVIGGYDDTGAAIKTVKKFNYTGSGAGAFTALHDLNTARGEPMVSLIPGTSDKYLIVAGRSSQTGTRLDTAEIYDATNDTMTALTNSSTHKLASPRVNFTLTPCGTSSLLVAGGQENTPSAVTTLETFTYNSGTPADSTFAPLVNTNASPATVTLSAARLFHGAIPLSTTKIVLVGGYDGSNYLSSSEILNLTSGCALNSSSATTPTSGPAMPAARAKFVSPLVSLTVESVAYNGIVAAGTANGSDAPTQTYLYHDDATTPTWLGVAVAPKTINAPSLNNGHILPAFAQDGSGNFAIVGGLSAPATSTSAVDYFVGTTTFGSSPALHQTRYGAWAAYIGGVSTPIAGMGVSRSASTDTWLNSTWSVE